MRKGRVSTGAEARHNGLARYFTGKPCKFGHVAERYSHNGQCLECGKLASKAHRDSGKAAVTARAAYEERRKREPEKVMWQSAKGRAKKSGVEFTIKPEDIKAVWPLDGRCPVLGITLEHNFDNGKGHAVSSPSLDRIKPEKGYVIGNIVVMSMRANRIKSNETNWRDLVRVASWMYKNERK
jgi:hypothetical protein